MSRGKKFFADSLFLKDDVCAFCGVGEDNELLYGKYIKSEEICVHSNCMFFASGLCQRGKNEKVGYSGFLLPDMKAEVLRGKKLPCTYCRKRGATVGCCNVKCKKSFHLPCGIEHNSLHQFYGTFCSFCKDHSPKQKKIEVIKDLLCHICCEKISNEELNRCLYSPCCKNSWFHKLCLQKYAQSAGLYFFKCPLCNNSKQFIKEMKTYGICIPDRDASWELEENAYQELLLHPECDATICHCSKGRTYTTENNSGWSLLSCSYCGSHARHRTCEKIKLSVNCWVCHECKLLEQKIRNNVSSDSCLNSSIKLEPLMEDSVPKEIVEVNSIPAVDKASSSTPIYPLSSNYLGHSENKIYDIGQADISNISFPSPVYCNKAEILSNTDVIMDVDENDSVKYENKNIISESGNVKHEIITPEKTSDGCELPNTAENDIKYSSPTKKFKISIQGKSVVNLKDIKNITANAFTTLCMPHIAVKQPNVKKVKRKKTEHICNTQNHCCIKRYFGQECGRYRL